MEPPFFPVERLLSGETRVMGDRLKTISFAMSWIQSQMEELRRSDDSLRGLFQRLEEDMSDLKSYYSDSRGRTSSVSSVNGIMSFRPSNISRSSLISVDEQFPIAEEMSILEESTPTVLEEDEDDDDEGDDDSLADFAEGLGEDEEDEFSENIEIAPASPQPHYRNNSSGFAEPISSSHESSTMSMEDFPSQLSFSSTITGAIPKSAITRNPSNDSGVQFAGADNDSASSIASHENATTTEDNEKFPSATSNSSVVDNRVSGFADEVLKLLKFS